jgi:hypothetical protein
MIHTKFPLYSIYAFSTLVASRKRFTSIFIISARLELNAANALFNAIGTSEANKSKSIKDKQIKI